MRDFQRVKLKYVAEIFTGNSIPDNEKNRYINGAIPYIPTKEVDADTGKINYDNGLSVNADDGFKIAPADSVLMCVEGGSAGKKIGVTEKQVAFVNKLCCLAPVGVFHRLLYYCLLSHDFQEQFRLNMTGMIGGVSVSALKNLSITLPPSEEEQRAISAYLDAQTAKIDEALSLNRMQIHELRLYKQSLITETVTRGLDPDAPMKDSGVDWIGQIPKHWQECRIKNVIFPEEKPIFTDDEIITCFRDGQVTLRKNRREDGFTFSDTEAGYHGVDVGDLVIHGMDAFAGAIGCSDSRGKITPVVHVCSTAGDNRYFMYYLRFMAYGNILMDLANGVRERSSDYRNFARLGVYGIIVPPLVEQEQIADFLDAECGKIDALISLKQSKIEKLTRYRQSLIYEYVTGKKEAP